VKLTYQSALKENWFLITWDLGNKCNYRCSYCPSQFNDGSTGWPSWTDVKAFVGKINKELPFKDICFRVSGGEPTYWKHFIDFAEVAKSYGNSFSFLSNGSRDISYFNAISPLTDGLILSYHPEYANPDHFIEISKTMECPVAVNLMLDQSNFDDMLAVAKYLYDNSNMAIWPKIILDKTDMINSITEYTVEQQDQIKNWPYFRKLDDSKIHRGELLLDNTLVTANDLILQKLNQHRGWECWAGLDMINIDFTGNIFRANCEQGSTLGTISNFTLPNTTIMCDKDTCNCLSDIYLRKQS
jgi:organic radical activating enzyme